MAKISEAMVGNWNESPWQPVRDGIRRVVLSGTHTENSTLQISECANGCAIRPHSHPYVQVAMVLEGSCDFYVDGKPYRLNPGGWVIIPKDVEHYIHVYDSPVPVVNLDIFYPERMEYVDAYDAFVESLNK